MRLVTLTGGRRYRGPVVVEAAWVGGVTTTLATIKARSEALASSSLDVFVSTSPSLSNPTAFAGVEGVVAGLFTFALTGLTPNTIYYFGFTGGSMTGRFKTFPVGQASFVIAASSCATDLIEPGPRKTSNSIAYDRIRDRDPIAFIHVGDLHYRDLNTTDVNEYRTAYRDVLSNPRLSHLVRTVPTAYVWDDHDYSDNNSDGTYVGKAVAQQAYREHVPHWTLPSATEIYQTFVIGRVRFILLDPRSGRDPNSDPDDANKTRLGATQKTWLKDTLLAATEPVIVLGVGSWWGETTGFDDGWEGFSTERQELAEWFVDNDVLSRLFMLGGDIHELMWDDGTNTQFDPGSSELGPPYAGFSPLDGTFLSLGATAQEQYQVTNQQYGTLAFTDTGSQITVTATGWAANLDGTETFVFSRSKVYSG